MGQNGEVPSQSPSGPRRGRRSWLSGVRAAPPAQPASTTPPGTPPPGRDWSDPAAYTPRRRYPWHDDPDYDPAKHRRVPPPRPFVPPEEPPRAAPPREEPQVTKPEPAPAEPGVRMPRKLTVTRVAAMRSRELTQKGIRAFHRATTADGADRSGLTALTYANMFDYAVDAAVAVALANTLFFAAATAESKTNVALYLAITVAPFAVVAPVIGPLLDRLQRGRRAAMAVSFFGRGVLAVVMALNYDTWLLYPAALGTMVLSKSCTVLKAAVTPRVLPTAITLVKTNSRLTVFGLISGAVFGGFAAGFSWLWGSAGALYFTAALCAVGTWLCFRIPRWVEATAGEVPATVRIHRGKTPMSRSVVVALWGNGAIRVLTGFLTLFVAFVVKAQPDVDAAQQLTLIGIVGAAAGLGSFVGNFAGSRMRFGHSDTVIVSCIAVAVAAAVTAVFVPGIALAATVALVAATTSAVAKVCLDAVVQRDLPEESRASAFGRSETILQLSWVFGGALGVLLPHDGYALGFGVVAAVVGVAGIQTALVSRGRALLPFLRHQAPVTGPTARVGS